MGLDEAGRGCLAGPVVAAAVAFKQNYQNCRFKDSKKLSSKQRDVLFDDIYASCFVGVGFATNEEIDRINILQASLLAMRRAFIALNIEADLILIDGNQITNFTSQAEVKAIVKGDSLIPQISAASIIAKVSRDRLINDLHQKHPEYDWLNNKTYGTKKHLIAIKQHGICEYHRLSFRPVKDSLV